MRRLVLAALLVMALALPARAAVVLSATQVDQGQAVLVKACGPASAKAVRARFLNREFALYRGVDGCWHGAVAADLMAQPGGGQVIVLADGKPLGAAALRVAPRDYGTRKITVKKKYTALSPSDLARYKREKRQWDQVVLSSTPTRFWRGGFLRPVEGSVTGPFGRRSLVNGKPRKPHSGVDLRGAEGTPVKAAAAGRVALVLDAFFSGHTVLIDHGNGLITRYLHLQKAAVRQGQQVAKGRIIGYVGSSGRVTGPHLDYGVTLAGARVDPLAWLAVSRDLSERLGAK